MEEMNSRLVRLERDLKICKFVIGLMGILIAALVGGEYVALRTSRTLGAAAVPKTIEAHEFVVVDGQNRPVALLGEIFPTRPMLIISEGLKTLPVSSLPLTDKNAAVLLGESLDAWPTFTLFADNDRADMEMRDQKSHALISASIDEFGPSDAYLMISSGVFDAVMEATPGSQKQSREAGASLRLSKSIAGKEFRVPGELDLRTHDDGETTLKMYGSQLKDRIELDGPTNSNPSLHLFDTDGNLRASLGSTSLEVTRTGAEETTAPSSLTFFDKKGKVLWQAPR